MVLLLFFCTKEGFPWWGFERAGRKTEIEKEREEERVGVVLWESRWMTLIALASRGERDFPVAGHTTSSSQLGFAKGALGFTLVYPLFDAVGVKVMHARQSTQLFAVFVLVLTYYT